MLQKILKPLSPKRIDKIINGLPKDSLYARYIEAIVNDAKLKNKDYAELIGLGNNMNEFYQIKHQAKEMVEEILFQQIQLETTTKNKNLKYSILSKFYFSNADHSLGKSYLKKIVDQETNDQLIGYQLDIMNGLFLDLTDRHDEENKVLIEKYDSLNKSFYEQTNNYVDLAKKLNDLINPNRDNELNNSKKLIEELKEINLVLDKLPMDAAIFKLEYRFAEMYISQNKKIEKEFIDFYIQLYNKWNNEDFFTERNHDLKLKSIVNITFLLLSIKDLALSQQFLKELQQEYLRYNKSFKHTHEVYYTSFSSYYALLKEDYSTAQEIQHKYEKKLADAPLQDQTKYFFYQSYARSSFYSGEIEKCIDIIAHVNQSDYKNFITPSRKMNWAIFEFLCHYRLFNYQYCKNILQKLRIVLRKSGKNEMKEKDVSYFKLVVKNLNILLRNVGYLEDFHFDGLSELMQSEDKDPLFYDKIINIEVAFKALKNGN